MIDTTTTTTGLTETIARLGRVQTRAAAAQRAVIQPLGTAYLEALQAETPKGRGEARGRQRLSASYEVQEHYDTSGAAYRIRNTAPQLRYVIRGRGPVVATRARALRFVIDGQVFFRKRVGPATPNDFPARVKAKMQSKIEAAKRQSAEVIVRVWEGGS